MLPDAHRRQSSSLAFGTPDHHLLIVNTHPVKLLEIVFPTLHEHITAAGGIHAIF